VLPPARRAAETEQPRRLSGDAVRRDQFLLLAERRDEAERVQAKADCRDREHDHEGDCRRAGAAQPLAPLARAEQEERQHEPGGDLDADSRHDGRHRAARPMGEQQQCEREQRDHDQVVVGAAERQHEQHGVQAHEGRCPCGRASFALGRERTHPGRGETCRQRDELDRPQAAGQPERDRRVAREREQRTVGRMRERPADEAEHGIGRHFGGEVAVGVQAVQGAEAREGLVAEHVLADQRRPEHEDQLREHDRAAERAHREAARAEQHEQIAGAHGEHQRLEAGAAQAEAAAAQRAGEPAWPAAAVGGHVLRRAARCSGSDPKRRGQHSEHAEGAQQAPGARARRRFQKCRVGDLLGG
jgi:hypothetical protein